MPTQCTLSNAHKHTLIPHSSIMVARLGKARLSVPQYFQYTSFKARFLAFALGKALQRCFALRLRWEDGVYYEILVLAWVDAFVRSISMELSGFWQWRSSRRGTLFQSALLNISFSWDLTPKMRCRQIGTSFVLSISRVIWCKFGA